MNPVEFKLIYSLPSEVKTGICCVSCDRPLADAFFEGVAVCENGHLLCSSYARQFPRCPGTKFKKCGKRLAICRLKWLEALFGPPHFLQNKAEDALIKNEHSVKVELSFSDSSNDEAKLEEPELSAEEEKPEEVSSGPQNCHCYPLLKDILKRQELAVSRGNRKIRGNEQPQNWISMTHETYMNLFHNIPLPVIEFHRNCAREKRRSKSQAKYSEEYEQKWKSRNNWEG